MISLELYRARVGKYQNVKSLSHTSPPGTMQPLYTLLPPSPLSNVKIPRSILFVFLLATLTVGNVNTTTSLCQQYSSQSLVSTPYIPPTFLSYGIPLHHNPMANKDEGELLLVQLPQVTSVEMNKYAHIINGNRESRGKKLTAMYWNKGNSYLVNKMEDIKTLVEQHKPMIFGIGEANVTADHDLKDVQLVDYNLHLASSIKNPNMRISRVVVYTHKKLVVKKREDLEDEETQAIFLEGGLANQRKTLWLMAYRQWKLVSVPGPGQRAVGVAGTETIAVQGERWGRILASWSKMLQEGKEVVSMMDSNLDHTNWTEDHETLARHSTSWTHRDLIEKLFNEVFSEGAVNMVAGPTWHRGQLKAGLDQVTSNKPEKLSPVEVLWTGMSDHAVLKTHRWSKTVPNQGRYIRKRSFRNFDPNIYRQMVKTMPEMEAIQLTDCVEVASGLLTQGLTRILDILAPLRTIQVRNNYAPHLSEETKELQSRREATQKQAVETGSQEDTRMYRMLRNQALASLRADRTRWEAAKLSTANSPADVWRTAKEIVGWSNSGPPTQLYIDGNHVTSPKAIASEMNKFFIKKQKRTISEIPVVEGDPLTKLRERMSGRQGSFTFQEVSEEEVLKLINSIKNSTSTGTDWIDNRCLKLAATELTPAITKIINLSITSSVFPSNYKASKLVPILKKDSNPLLCNSWRPVNQLVVVGKLVERTLFRQLVRYIEDNKLLHPSQHGGREGHSTTTALIEMYDKWVEDMEEGKTVAIMMIDQSAAFDVCDHIILEAKLQLILGLGDGTNLNSGGPVMRWFHSYLSGRLQCTIVEGQISPLLRMPACSVIQGGCGAGLLYSILTSDLPDCIHPHTLHHFEAPVHCSEDGNMTTFVDDSTSYFGHKDPIIVKNITQKNYEATELYMHRNNLKINGDKTHMIVMTKGDSVGGGVAAAERREVVTLLAGGKVIEGSEYERLLGGIIHHSGNWRRMIRDGKGSVTKQMATRIAALKIMSRNAEPKTKLMLAGGIVQAKLTYLLPLFGAAPAYLINALQVQQLAAARVVLGYKCYRWSTEKILNAVGWLSVRQLHQYSVFLLTHRIITTGRPRGLHSVLVSSFPYNTRRVEERQEGMQHTPRQLRYGEQFGQTSTTSLVGRSFRHQALAYNKLPAYLRSLRPNCLKPKLKQWIKFNVPVK